MFDHVTIHVPDRERSESFFETVLTTLGVDTTYRTNSMATWHDFGVTHADEEHQATRGLHIGFSAPSREQVDDFWQAGIAAGYADDGRPGPRPEYVEDYYGAFLRSPDGNSIEAVHHGDARRGEGVVDHIWIRVADLEASTAFYNVIAEVAGLIARPSSAERTTFAGPSGGSFSLVQGTPTENLHMAFPGDNAAVERFHAAAVAAGYRDHGEPAERARYHAGYYAAYVLDPDGNNIEVVSHNRV
jgi:catechol 2,3-dioxygenase-like lactoylglutathione lyase family enzyme